MAGCKSACMTRRMAKCDWQDSRRSPAKQGGCDDPNDACIGGDRIRCRLVYSCHKAVLNDPSFPKSAPFAADFLKSMDIVKDFWAEPSYAELLLDMQKRVHDYVVADKGTAKEALDLLVKDWQKVFKGEGKI
jgi:hypothetical protein